MFSPPWPLPWLTAPAITACVESSSLPPSAPSSAILENLSIATGFPFGHYEFLALMGPKLFRVPILLGLAYIGMAYVSWILGCLIAGE